MGSAFSPRESLSLPNEMQLGQALKVYFARLLIFGGVILANIVIFAAYVGVAGVRIVPKPVSVAEPTLNVAEYPNLIGPATTTVFQDDFEGGLDHQKWRVVGGTPLIFEGKLTSSSGMLTIQPEGLSLSQFVITSEWSSDLGVTSNFEFPAYPDSSVPTWPQPVRYSLQQTSTGLTTSWQSYSISAEQWMLIGNSYKLSGDFRSWKVTIWADGQAITAIPTNGESFGTYVLHYYSNRVYPVIHISEGSYLEYIQIVIPNEQR